MDIVGRKSMLINPRTKALTLSVSDTLTGYNYAIKHNVIKHPLGLTFSHIINIPVCEVLNDKNLDVF